MLSARLRIIFVRRRARRVGVLAGVTHDLDADLRRRGFHFGVQHGDEACALAQLAQVGIRRIAATCLGVAEMLFDQLFHQRDVHITHDHEHGALGRIPLLIEVREAIAAHFLDRVLEADGHATRQQGVGHGELVARLHGARVHAVARQLLAEDHSPLLVDLLLRPAACRRGHRGRVRRPR